MTATVSIVNYLMKLKYADGLDDRALRHNNPFLALCEHETDFTTSKGIEIPSPYVNPQGIGSSAASAVAAKSPSKGQSFTVPQRTIKFFFDLEHRVVENAMQGGDMTQFESALSREVDGSTESFGQEINQRLYGDNGGIRCYLGTGSVTTTTPTLAKPTDAQFIEPGMQLVAVNPATGAVRTGGTGYVVVSAVNPITGVITLTGTLDTEITSVVAGDGLARRSMPAADLDGVKGWCPQTPSASFLGVNQTLYIGRACGLYLNKSALPVRTGLLDGYSIAESLVGKRFDGEAPCLINPRNLSMIEQAVEASRVVNTTMEGSYGVGIPVKEINGFRFIKDAHCPRDEVVVVGKGAFTLGTCGKQPKLDNADGNSFFHDRETDLFKGSMSLYGNSYSYSPYNLLRIAIAAAS